MLTKPIFNVEQLAAIKKLEKALKKSKESGLPLSIYASDAVVFLPTASQSKAIDIVNRAVKLASKVQLEIRVTEKIPFVIDLIDLNSKPLALTY